MKSPEQEAEEYASQHHPYRGKYWCASEHAHLAGQESMKMRILGLIRKELYLNIQDSEHVALLIESELKDKK